MSEVRFTFPGCSCLLKPANTRTRTPKNDNSCQQDITFCHTLYKETSGISAPSFPRHGAHLDTLWGHVISGWRGALRSLNGRPLCWATDRPSSCPHDCPSAPPPQYTGQTNLRPHLDTFWGHVITTIGYRQSQFVSTRLPSSPHSAHNR